MQPSAHPHPRARATGWMLVLLALGLACCADRTRRNPLDAEATDPLNRARGLTAIPGDGRVDLRWDFTRFDDVRAVRLFRDDGDTVLVRDLPPADTLFVDDAVRNGTIYSYRITLDVEGEGELAIAGEPLATPGPERAWVGDEGREAVLRLTPDGRHVLFERGRFPQLSGIALDGVSGDCWVSDGRLGLYRITPDGDVQRLATDLDGTGALVVGADRGWVAGPQARRVFRFDLPAGDSLALEPMDATFADSVALAADGRGGVWIGDAGRRRAVHFDDDARRTGEWTDLPQLVAIAAVSDAPPEAWVLSEGGQRLLRLLPEGERIEVDLPFAPARRIDAAPATGRVWVSGDSAVAAFDIGGGQLLLWPDDAGGRGLVVDDANGQVWVAGGTQLTKITLGDLTYRARLTGFTSVIQVAVDPGR